VKRNFPELVEILQALTVEFLYSNREAAVKSMNLFYLARGDVF
jgi:hypothetical protein